MSERMNASIIGASGTKSIVPVKGAVSGGSDGLYSVAVTSDIESIVADEKAEGIIDLDIPGNGNKFMIKYLFVTSASADFNIQIFLDAACTAYKVYEALNNNLILSKIFDANGLPYVDLAGVHYIHVKYVDTPGADHCHIVIVGSVAA